MILQLLIFEEGSSLSGNWHLLRAPKRGIPNLKSSTTFAISAVPQGSDYCNGIHRFWASITQSQCTYKLLKQISSMAFEIMFLIHHYEFIKTLFESLQQLPWHHHQKLKYFALSSMELHNSASSPSIYSHFNASLAAYIALITMTTPRLQGHNLLSNPSFRSLSATMFIKNHLIPYSQLGGIWPLLHTHI